MIREPVFTGNSEKDIKLIQESLVALINYINNLDRNYINTGETVGIDDIFNIYNKVGNMETKTSNVLKVMEAKQKQEAGSSGTVNHSTIASILESLIDAMKD